MRYISLLRYKPRDNSKLGNQCQGIVNAIKNDQALAEGTLASEAIAQVLSQVVKDQTNLQQVFDGKAALIPIPRSARRSKDALWPSLRIANALCKHGLGSEVLIAVERHKNIRSAHTSGRNRPTVDEHLETLRSCLPLNAKPRRIILVDDVITKGATAWACRGVLQDEVPAADIITFAAVSTEHPDATLIGPIAIRDGVIQHGPYGQWRPDTKNPATWASGA
ncbi:MAG: hypothetical protein GC159_17695 [Phycisphaera sp.]|nr:hypothetical protein [Phycisphaera sp.]